MAIESDVRNADSQLAVRFYKRPVEIKDETITLVSITILYFCIYRHIFDYSQYFEITFRKQNPR